MSDELMGMTQEEWEAYLEEVGDSNGSGSDDDDEWGADKDVKDLNEVDDVDEQLFLALEYDNVQISEFDVDPIVLSGEVYQKIKVIMHKIPKHEWAAMLETEDGTPFTKVTDIFFPEQKADKTSAYEIDDESTMGYTGFIHSHHQMGVGSSKCDEDGVHSNYDISLVVAWDSRRKGTLEFEGSIRLHKDDSRIIKAKTDVMVDYDVGEGFMDQIDDNYTQKRRKTWSGKKSRKNGVTYLGSSKSGRRRSSTASRKSHGTNKNNGQ